MATSRVKQSERLFAVSGGTSDPSGHVSGCSDVSRCAHVGSMWSVNVNCHMQMQCAQVSCVFFHRAANEYSKARKAVESLWPIYLSYATNAMLFKSNVPLLSSRHYFLSSFLSVLRNPALPHEPGQKVNLGGNSNGLETVRALNTSV